MRFPWSTPTHSDEEEREAEERAAEARRQLRAQIFKLERVVTRIEDKRRGLASE